MSIRLKNTLDPAEGNLYSTLVVEKRSYRYIDLRAAERAGYIELERLPFTFRILAENVLRRLGPQSDEIDAIRSWLVNRSSELEISFYPARVLMPDSSGVPLIGDLAAMRDAVSKAGGEPGFVNPSVPVHVVVDHSAVTDHAGAASSYDLNLALEYRRNIERYTFLKWAQSSFNNLRVVPPSMGIVHQINLECLAKVVWTDERQDGECLVYPDSLVGMDSHTPMINGIGVLGWGVGGIEAGAVMLGEPISMQLPRVLGCKIVGKPAPGVSSTDIALTLTELLRQHNVVGKFVEYYGDGLKCLPVAHRATIANMAPEAGATMSFFPPDEATLEYLAETGRSREQIELVRSYTIAQGLWSDPSSDTIEYSETLEFDLGEVEQSLAGPSRPQDRVTLGSVPQRFRDSYPALANNSPGSSNSENEPLEHRLDHGDIVIAAITSCTNTSNPQAMVGAGLLARKLRERGVTSKPWVKTSLAPGSRVVSDYLISAGLQSDLDALGFNLVGYGCMTCASASGPLASAVAEEIESRDLVVATVLSSNRNFEGRTHPLARANFICSPALVVAYACAGSVTKDLRNEPIAHDKKGEPVWLKDVWPTDDEIDSVVGSRINPGLFLARYSTIFEGDERWRRLDALREVLFRWDPNSTYIRPPPYFADAFEVSRPDQINVSGARVLLQLGDSITTDHISPVNAIHPKSLAGRYLKNLGVDDANLGTLLGRRGNHDVMLRGTFTNPRLKNEMLQGMEGGYTPHMPSGDVLSIFDASQRYRAEHVPLVIVAGTEYGTGSSRDWAAKGTALLGVEAVIAESFERIHRSNLIGMGVLPLQFAQGVNRHSLELSGKEVFSITGPDGPLLPRQSLTCEIYFPDGTQKVIHLISRLDIPREVEWYRCGGILPYVADKVIAESVDLRGSRLSR